ncbi:hypothetical protein F5146DRAFT_1133632 [Armillaria mellea]|nr:hypothetical protein F5146DRAFT_1133632 [Armillaria mellea]
MFALSPPSETFAVNTATEYALRPAKPARAGVKGSPVELLSKTPLKTTPPTLVKDEAVTGGQPEPIRPLANRDRSRGTTGAGKKLKKGKTTERDGDRSKVGGAIDPERYRAHSAAERKSSLDLNDGREAFGWVRSIHERDPEGLYLKASQLGVKEFVIWPDEHDAENETN